MPLKMKELPEAERPYEKLKMYGEDKLSIAELLAIIIKTGTKEENSLDIANRILMMTDNLLDLATISINDLMKIKGVGEVKAIQIKAVYELSRRISSPQNNFKIRINNPKIIADILMNELRDEKQEQLKLIILNTKNEIIKTIVVVKGDTNVVNVSIKQILAEPIKNQAPKIILAHNHPSGDSTPSMEDVLLTKEVMKACDIFGIKLLDHIVIGNNNYHSILSMPEFKNF